MDMVPCYDATHGYMDSLVSDAVLQCGLCIVKHSGEAKGEIPQSTLWFVFIAIESILVCPLFVSSQTNEFSPISDSKSSRTGASAY